MAEIGSVYAVRYRVGGPVVWHERVVVGYDPRLLGRALTLTPDSDCYFEDFGVGSPELTAVALLPGLGGLVAGIAAGRVYRFRSLPSRQAILALVDEAVAAEPTARVQRDFVIAQAAGAPVVPLVGGGDDPRAPPPAAAGPAAPPEAAAPAPLQAEAPFHVHALAEAPAPGPPGADFEVAAMHRPPPGLGAAMLDLDEVWAAAEDRGGFARGAILDLPPGAVIVGDRALVARGGETLVLARLPRAAVADWAAPDIRVLPVRFDLQGERRRDFGDAVNLMSGEENGIHMDIQGPRTSMWFLKYVRQNGGSPHAAHEAWIRASGVGHGDRSVFEHEVLSRILEALCCIDQVNAPTLLGVELLIRRIQLIREAHRVSPHSPDYSASDQFMGWGTRRHGGAIAPALAQFVSGELRAEAAISKEARKAREERTLRGARGGGGDEQGGGGRGGNKKKDGRGGRGGGGGGGADAAASPQA